MNSVVFLLHVIYQFCKIFGDAKITADTIRVDYIEACIGHILSSKTHFGADLAVINSGIVTNGLIRRIHETNNVKVYIKDYKVSMNSSPNIYMIHVQDLFNFEELIDNLDRDWHRNPNALHIIILRDTHDDDFVAIFRLLWEYHIIHALVVIDEMNENASIYSYYPYAEGGCGRDYNNTLKLSECKSVTNSDILATLIENDKPVLRNCTLRVATHNFPPIVISHPDPVNKFAIGIESILLEILVKMENISLNYTFLPETYDFGDVSTNFTVTGILEKLYENEVDLVFGGFGLNHRRSIFFDAIYSHLAFEDSLVVVTPSTDLVERWKIVYMMFSLKTWLILLVVFIFCAILLSDFNNYLNFRNENDSSSEVLNLLGSITKNLSLNLRKHIYKNLIIAHWLWLVLFLDCFYQTRLTSYSTFRAFNPQLNEYNSLQNYNFTPCLAPNIILYLNKSGQVNIINKEFLEIQGCETADLALDQVAETKSKYTVTLFLRYLWWKIKRPERKGNVHLVKENLNNILYALFFKRGFPLLREYDTIMLRLVEHGFVDGAKRLHQIPKEARSVGDLLGSFDICILKLEDISIPLGILIAGVCFAFLTFILEVLHKDNYNVE